MNGQIAEVDAMLRPLLDATMFNGGHKLKLDIGELDMRSLAEESCLDMPAETDRYVVSGDGIVGFWCRVAMERALQNLLSNAHKYGTPGTSIDAVKSWYKTREQMTATQTRSNGMPILKQLKGSFLEHLR